MSLSLFQETWYLKACSQNHEIQTIASLNGDGVELGSMSFEIRRKIGFKILGMPLLTQYTGPVLSYPSKMEKNHSRVSFENKVILDLIDKLPKVDYINFSCSPEITNMLPFLWSGFSVSPKYTYILTNIKNRDLLFLNLKGSVRTILNKSPEIKIVEEKNPNILYDLSRSVFQKQRKKIPFTLETLKNIISAVEKNAQMIYLSAYTKDNVPVASTLTIIYNNKAYFLLSGMDEMHKSTNAVTYLIWESIQEASVYVDVFDFEGSILPGVEKLFRSFGGNLIPYFNVQKTNHPILSIIKK